MRVASDLFRASPAAFSRATLQAAQDCSRYPGLGNYKFGDRGELPVERPATFEFVINLKTAETLRLSLPQSLLARADDIIQ